MRGTSLPGNLVRRTIRSVVSAILLACAIAIPLRAQQPDSSSVDEYRQLQKLRSERAMLTRILGAMNVVDSAYIVHYPSWIIKDEDIRQRVYKTFRNRLKFPSRDSELVVITSPQRDDIIRLSMGDESLGREETRLYVGENLRNAILARNYSRTELEDYVGSRRKPTLTPTVNNVILEGSFFGGRLQFANGWGMETRIGNDAMNLPFWSSGSVEALLLIDKFKVGVVLPLNVGLSTTDIGPFSLQSRKLNGATGFALEYEHQLFGGNLLFHLQTNNLQHVDSVNTLTDPEQFYYIRTMVQGVLMQQVAAIGNEHFINLGVGLGYDQIGRASIVQPGNEAQTAYTINDVHPIIKIDYQHLGNRTYGASLQSYSSSIMVTGWIELLKNFIFMDLKYSTPVFRGTKNWENSYFVMISPRFRLAF